jgi:hypothetical protein
MNIEQLFCFAMADLDACILSTWQYHQMRIAGIVRLLTFDEHPLAHQINRHFRLSLRFTYYTDIDGNAPSASDEFKVGGLSFAVASFDPRPILDAGGTGTQASLDQWLKTGALRLQGKVLSVQEFTQRMAYVEGLVHAGKPKDDFERFFVEARTALRRLDNFSLIGFDLLKQIGRVTHTGLLPLRNAVQIANFARDGEYPKFSYDSPAS